MINLLIVDDHPIVRRGLKDVLRDESDLSVAEAANGREALSKIKEQQFDLIILDLEMPGMSGMDELKEIKREHKKLPVLVLSVYPQDQVALRLLKAGASGFLSKETAPEQLVRAIRRIRTHPVRHPPKNLKG